MTNIDKTVFAIRSQLPLPSVRARSRPMPRQKLAEIAAAAGARVAIATVEKATARLSKERVDQRLYNIKLLLRNYRLLKLHTQNAVYEQGQTDDEIQSLIEKIWEFSELEYNDSYIDAIRRGATRTAIIVNHIDDMMTMYEIFCARSQRQEDMRRYRVVKALYLSAQPVSAQEVADIEMIDTRTVYKDVNAACVPLSTLLFGIDALRG